MKREMIKALHEGCPGWNNDTNMQQKVLSRFKKYGDEVH